ncbi:hypothetical protein TNCV_1599241 [Trichonephila clavipes]|nr:hypothetical protein TNCV_1599241 [Trichonephila clavipes]
MNLYEAPSNGCVVAHRSSPSQVRGSNPGLGKAYSAFHSFCGPTNEYQACLETKHWEVFTSDGPPDLDISSSTSMHKVTKTEMGTVGLGPYRLLSH